MTTRSELNFALEIVKQAGLLANDYFEQGVSCEMKSDQTPVTKADKEIEEFLRKRIAEEFPGDVVLGEESSEIGKSIDKTFSGRRWIVDPIDGTYNFARGIPIFSTLLAFQENNEIQLGVIHAPAIGDTFFASAGGGAFKNGESLHVSKIDNLAEAQLNFGSPKRILTSGLWDGFSKLVDATYRQRGFGDYLSFALLFEGKAELALEVGLKPWDLAPMKIIAEEAGGAYHDLEGGSSIFTGSCLITNSLVSKEALNVLLSKQPPSFGHKRD